MDLLNLYELLKATNYKDKDISKAFESAITKANVIQLIREINLQKQIIDDLLADTLE